jgi:hypothetical protein
MPADLPPASAYTYAVDLSADEAAGVTFSQPVPFYVENFIGFPVGAPIPAAYFDSTKGQWIPSQSGQVIAILSITGGLADVDVDGSGTAASAAALSALEMSAHVRLLLRCRWSRHRHHTRRYRHRALCLGRERQSHRRQRQWRDAHGHL